MTRCQVDRKLGGPQGHAGHLRKISAPLGFDPRTFRPLASCYTNYAITPIIIIIIIIILTLMLPSSNLLIIAGFIEIINL